MTNRSRCRHTITECVGVIALASVGAEPLSNRGLSLSRLVVLVNESIVEMSANSSDKFTGLSFFHRSLLPENRNSCKSLTNVLCLGVF